MRCVISLSLVLALVACQSSESKGVGEAPAKGTSAAKEVPAAKPAGSFTKLEKLNLQVELPEGSSVSDGIGGDGVMVMSVTGPFNVSLATDSKPKTVDAAKKDAEMFNPKNVKTEKLADGWLLTFENEGSAGTNYWLTIRREIGGKAYICDTSVFKDEQRAAAIKACKSLKP